MQQVLSTKEDLDQFPVSLLIHLNTFEADKTEKFDAHGYLLSNYG